MKQTLLGCILALTLSVVHSADSWAGEPAAQSQGKLITDLRVFLYHESSGKFDEYDLTKSPDPLKNIAIHSADGPSRATLVKIDVDVAHLPADMKLELLATAGGRILFKDRAPVEKDRNDEQHDPVAIPFIVHGTGCETVKLSARLLDKKGHVLASTAKTLDFSCWYD